MRSAYEFILGLKEAGYIKLFHPLLQTSVSCSPLVWKLEKNNLQPCRLTAATTADLHTRHALHEHPGDYLKLIKQMSSTDKSDNPAQKLWAFTPKDASK